MKYEGYVIVTHVFYEENHQWVGTCRELGTSVCADTREEAIEHLREAVVAHLSTLEDVRERRRFFKEHNIQYHRVEPSSVSSRPTVRPGMLVEKQLLRVPA